MTKRTKIIIGLLVATIANMMAVMTWVYKKYDELCDKLIEVNWLYIGMGTSYHYLFKRFKEIIDDPNYVRKVNDTVIEEAYGKDMMSYKEWLNK